MKYAEKIHEEISRYIEKKRLCNTPHNTILFLLKNNGINGEKDLSLSPSVYKNLTTSGREHTVTLQSIMTIIIEKQFSPIDAYCLLYSVGFVLASNILLYELYRYFIENQCTIEQCNEILVNYKFTQKYLLGEKEYGKGTIK